MNSLIKTYVDKINFAVVALSNNRYSMKYIQDKFTSDIPVLFDQSVADLCGVYSTPQAVILNTDYTPYYLDDYNKSKY